MTSEGPKFNESLIDSSSSIKQSVWNDPYLTYICGTIWGIMCGIMIYVKTSMWWVFGASMFFFALGKMIEWLSRQWNGFHDLKSHQQLTWINISVSLCHSSIISGTILHLLWTERTFFENCVMNFHIQAFLILCISTGYFAYDLWEMIRTGLYRKAPSIILHHSALLICFVYALFESIGLPYLILTLLCEINSVFLHLRKLCQLAGMTFVNPLYLVLWGGLGGSFVICRLVVHICILYWVFIDRNLFPFPIYFKIAFGGMLIFNLLNLELCQSLIKAFLKEWKMHQQNQKAHSIKTQ